MAAEPRSTTAVRYIDVVVVLVAAIPALALGAPALGYLVGGGFWILQRVHPGQRPAADRAAVR